MGADGQVQLLPQETAAEPRVPLGEHLEEGAEGPQAVRVRGVERETARGTAGPEQGRTGGGAVLTLQPGGWSTPEQVCAEGLQLLGKSHAGAGEKGAEEAAAETVD